MGPSGVAKFHLLLQDECESLLDWHCTLPEVLYLTLPKFHFKFLLQISDNNYLGPGLAYMARDLTA